MMDGIIKADGTSRLMRAELPATYEEFRAQCRAGTQPLDVLFNAIGWRQLPTFLNKANLLKDPTAAMFGFGADSVPDAVLSFLGKYAQHWWRRRSTSGYILSLGDSESLKITDTSSAAATVRYSDTVNILEDGTLSLNNPVTLTVPSEGASILTGRYFEAALNCSFSSDIIYFCETNPAWDFSQGEDYKTTARKVSAVLGNTSEWEIVRSSNRNAYPDSGVSNGYEYQYICMPLDNAAQITVKIATGSYTGTGTYGASNPNRLTFDFEPKLVIVKQAADSFLDLVMIRGCTSERTNDSGAGANTVTWTENGVEWYLASGTSPQYQMNYSYSYVYIAIG